MLLLSVMLIKFLLLLYLTYMYLFWFLYWIECSHLYYIQNTPWVALSRKVSYDTTFRVQITNKQNGNFNVLFWTVILFNCLNVNNVNMLFLFVCLSDFTLVFQILWHSWSIEGKSSCANHSTIFAERNRKYVSLTLLTAKIKIRKKLSPRFWDKTAKIWRCENIPLYDIFSYDSLSQSVSHWNSVFSFKKIHCLQMLQLFQTKKGSFFHCHTCIQWLHSFSLCNALYTLVTPFWRFIRKYLSHIFSYDSSYQSILHWNTVFSFKIHCLQMLQLFQTKKGSFFSSHLYTVVT